MGDYGHMTKILCKFCRKDITNKRIYYILLKENADMPICYDCFKYPVEEKEVKYTRYNRWEIMDI